MFTRVGQPMLLCCDAICGEGSEREQCCLFCSLPVFSHFPCYPQSNWAILALVPGWWACECSRTLLVSPTNSSVRLGVSPAAASTPTGVLNKRFEALFPRAGGLVCEVCFVPPPFLLVYLCTNVGPRGLLAAAWPAWFHNPPPSQVC